MRGIILDATAGGMHILMCICGMTFFLVQLKSGESKLELKKILIGIVIGFSVIFGIILIACYFEINLVRQSYHDRVMPMQEDIRLNYLLATSAIQYPYIEFQPFALFPLVLIAFGVAVAVVACFWIAHKAIGFANKADDLKRRDIVDMKRSVAQLITLTSIIFTTSTLATIALMQIGRDWIEKRKRKGRIHPKRRRDEHILVCLLHLCDRINCFDSFALDCRLYKADSTAGEIFWQPSKLLRSHLRCHII